MPPKRPLPVFAVHGPSWLWMQWACLSHAVDGCPGCALPPPANVNAAITTRSSERTGPCNKFCQHLLSKVTTFAAEISPSVSMDALRETQEAIGRLVVARQQLRAQGANRAQLEANRLHLVAAQQRLSRQLLGLYLPESAAA